MRSLEWQVRSDRSMEGATNEVMKRHSHLGSSSSSSTLSVYYFRRAPIRPAVLEIQDPSQSRLVSR